MLIVYAPTPAEKNQNEKEHASMHAAPFLMPVVSRMCVNLHLH